MRVAFLCDTPFQSFNATRLHYGLYHGAEDVISDLYIVDQFRNARRIYDNIKALNLFDNVYLLRREENRFIPRGLRRSIRVAYSYFNPVHAFRNQSDEEIPRDMYDIVYAGIMRCITGTLLKLSPKAEFHLFDDGTGSYTGDIVANGGGKAYKLFSKITGLGANTARAKKLYVSNLPMCHSTAADELCQMPPMSQEFLELAYKIYDFEPAPKPLSGIILMSQPAGPGRYRPIVDGMAAAMSHWKDQTIVRMHPRDTEFDRYEGFQLDTKGEMWELKIANIDEDNLLLVGTYSTAQITPKMLFNKEPWLLFMYRMLYGSENQDLIDASETLAADIINAYTNKDRVMIPRNEEELNACMERFLNR